MLACYIIKGITYTMGEIKFGDKNVDRPNSIMFFNTSGKLNKY